MSDPVAKFTQVLPAPEVDFNALAQAWADLAGAEARSCLYKEGDPRRSDCKAAIVDAAARIDFWNDPAGWVRERLIFEGWEKGEANTFTSPQRFRSGR